MLIQSIMTSIVCSIFFKVILMLSDFINRQKRPCYYDSLFIACKNDVDKHIMDVYAKSARSKVS